MTCRIPSTSGERPMAWSPTYRQAVWTRRPAFLLHLRASHILIDSHSLLWLDALPVQQRWSSSSASLLVPLLDLRLFLRTISECHIKSSHLIDHDEVGMSSGSRLTNSKRYYVNDQRCKCWQCQYLADAQSTVLALRAHSVSNARGDYSECTKK